MLLREMKMENQEIFLFRLEILMKHCKIYTDVTLFTSHQQILKISRYLNSSISTIEYIAINILLFLISTRTRFYKLIDREILHALAGRKAYIK
jgi:polyphosphate kinase